MGTDALRSFWQRPLVRRIAVALLFGAAVVLQYRLAHFPQPVDVSQYPAVAKRGQQLVIRQAAVKGPLLSCEGSPDQTVRADFDRAVLDRQTLRRVLRLAPDSGPPPPGPQKVVYVRDVEKERQNAKAGRDGGEAGKTVIAVEWAEPPKPSAALYLYQLESTDAAANPRVEMRAVGGRLAVTLFADTASDDESARGCAKLLLVGEDGWQKSIGTARVRMVMEEGSGVRFRFSPQDPKSPLLDKDGLFEPFALGTPRMKPEDPPPFPAAEVAVLPLGGAGEPSPPRHLLARSSAGQGSLLSVDHLRVGSEQLQLAVSGRGRAVVDGQPVTVDLLTRFKDNPLLGALAGAADTALIAWFTGVVLARRRAAAAPEEEEAGKKPAPPRAPRRTRSKPSQSG